MRLSKYISCNFLIVFFLGLTVFQNSHAQGFLDVKGKYIVNEKGEKVLLRGMGLGGWMLQEGYMLRINDEGQQYKIKAKIQDLIGEERTNDFYNAWLSNHTQKADIDSMKAWGFNSVRLPMHYNLYTLPVEDEKIKGENTWIEKGFAMTDSLLSWCKSNNMYLILDLHAAPGGQGNDNNISDRNPDYPSLWENPVNREKTIELWKKLAIRYKDEPNIGAYDILNEPNWGFSDTTDRHGLKEDQNIPLRNLMVDITKAIREIDQKHIIILEGNGWGNNYNGIFPLWDDKTVISFHKYWNYNTQGSIQQFIDIREKNNAPIWLGESGENSNTWFNQAISLAEKNEIGWCWWPLKKMGFNNPLEIKWSQNYQNILNYWNDKGPKPSQEKAYNTFMQLAENSKIENCIIHYDVLDAMFRQVHDNSEAPFKPHKINQTVKAVDYDLGKNNVAYFDTDTAEYYISTGKERSEWNSGRVYRNDGVDIASDIQTPTGYYITKIEDGEWLDYSVFSPKKGNYNMIIVVSNFKEGSIVKIESNIGEYSKIVKIPISASKSWDQINLGKVKMKEGVNQIRIIAVKGGFDFQSFKISD